MITDFEAFCALALMAPFMFHLVLRTRRYLAVARARMERSEGYIQDCKDFFKKQGILLDYVIEHKLDYQVYKEHMRRESDTIDKKWGKCPDN